MALIVGIDNGVTGAIAVVRNRILLNLVATPVTKSLDYQSSVERHIHRVDVTKLAEIFQEHTKTNDPVLVFLERPMITAVRFSASISAARSFEATLIVLEGLQLNYKIVSSSYWQCNLTKEELDYGTKAAKKSLHKRKLVKEDNKQVYAEIAKKLYPNWTKEITNVNADAVLLATIASQKYS